jgi:hypothetical protein
MGQSFPQHILVNVGHQAHQVHCLPPPDGCPNRGHPPNDHAHPVHVQF